jgi:hypothetical protein
MQQQPPHPLAPSCPRPPCPQPPWPPLARVYAGRLCSGVFRCEEAKGVIGLRARICGAIVAFKNCSPLKNENIEP